MENQIESDQAMSLAQTESMAVLANNVAVCAIAFRDQLLGSTATIPDVCQEIELSLEVLGDGVGVARFVARSATE